MQLPPRDTSRYAHTCSDVDDRARLERAVVEAEEVALAANDGDVAQARFELVLECAHRLVELGLEADAESVLVERVAALAETLAQRARATVAESADPAEPADPDAWLDPGVSIEPDVLARVQPALVDAGFRVVHGVRIANNGERVLRDARVRCAAEPAFAAPLEVAIAELGPGQVVVLDAVALKLDRRFFGALTERARGTLHIELVHADPADDADVPRVLARAAAEVELCPPGEWPGVAVHPEHLASFCLPNEGVVQELLGGAARFLADWTKDPALDGYQSKDPARALAICAAVYAALQARDLTYANPPASFVESGQRVRLPADVLGSRLGTCIDLALLHAAGLEQAGLHPLLVVIEGHAFAGCWLEDEVFGEAVQYDALALGKRVELGAIALFDSTCCSMRPSVPFDLAQETARQHLVRGKPFVCAIDVVRARRAGVRPLATFGGELAASDAPGIASTPTSAPDVERLAALERLHRSAELLHQRGAEVESGSDRIDRWRRKLLDLTKRNRLLSHREGKRTVPLLVPSAAALEDALATGAAFRIEPRPSEADAARQKRPEATRGDVIEELAPLLAGEFSRRRLCADVSDAQLEDKLVTLYREARVAAEEGGSSTLYLAIGFLHYRETRTSSARLSAPILLVPVELERHSVRKGFSLVLGGDEPTVNVTLLEYLARDHGIAIPGLEALPEDDSGVDVDVVLHALREAVSDREGWVVSNAVALEIYSFAKILIHKDLTDRRADLLASPVVDHLVNHPNEAWDDGVEFPRLERLDDDFPPTEVLCPLSSDSSQLAAVIAAAQGKSFVLHGPPGTGKSQTITNLVAHLLATGKRVLFVSEKMAALEVVRARLEQVGLGEACLELHSNKAKKREVLEQLRTALEARGDGGLDEWRDTANEYGRARTELNALVRALHGSRTSGESVHAVLARLVSIEDRFGVELEWRDIAETDAATLVAAREAARRMVETGDAVGPEHALLAVGREAYSLSFERDARAAVATLSERIDAAAQAGLAARERIDLAERPYSREAWSRLAALVRRLEAAPLEVSQALAIAVELDGIEARGADWIARARAAAAARAALDATYTEHPRSLGLDQLDGLVRKARTSWFLPAWFARRAVQRALRSIAREPRAITFDRAVAGLADAREVDALAAALAEVDAAARAALGSAWNGEQSDFAALGRLVAWSAGWRDDAAALARAGDHGTSDVRAAAWSACSSGGGAKRIDGALLAFAEAHDAYEQARRSVESVLELEPRGWSVPAGDDAFAADRRRASRWTGAWRELPEWCAWRRARRAAIDARLESLVHAIEESRVDACDASDAFERAFAGAWFQAVASDDAVLASFVGKQHDLLVERFVRLDDEVLALTRRALRARVLGSLGGGLAALERSGRAAPASSELGVLQRELVKKARHKALRRLFAEIPSVLARLKPCMLMSPLSVAQYLDPAGEPFDVVVFDEASQIPVQDAIGTIARGRQVVVVGDPKQLPPTSFFQRGASDGELDGDEDLLVDDQESILDECLASRLPSLYLGWHYRSRHESLIAFSNRRYYDGRLVTFPARDDAGLGVSLRFVEGATYDHGASRTNRVEAEAVVAEIERRLASEIELPAEQRRSLGVVTFNQPQQVLIEDLLDELRRRRPELDERFDGSDGAVRGESVFVKNLENVQGDERDAILFSIGYGPDAHGRVHLNFGPLNQSGGERRLNVAITRARREAVVFTCLRPEQIDLSRTKAAGTRDLKLFLEYAAHGPRVFATDGATSSENRAKALLEDDLARTLEERGHRVERRVGCSEYRLDLAVLDPRESGGYLLGIECDGAVYAAAHTARDRDRLRGSVLAGLGWRVHRVWAMEWWRDRDREITRIEAAIEEALDARRGGSDAAPPAPIPRTPVVPPSDAPLRSTATRTLAKAAVEDPLGGTPYTAAKLRQVRRSRDAFYKERSLPIVVEQLREVVDVEAPIALDLAARRVAESWGIDRLAARVRGVVQQAARALELVVEDDAGTQVLWRAGATPDEHADFRPPRSDRDAREIDEIATRELANGARAVLTQFGGMERRDLVREVARVFGFARTGSRVEERVEAALDRLIASGVAVAEDVVVKLGS